jgi:hypothetical protein
VTATGSKQRPCAPAAAIRALATACALALAACPQGPERAAQAPPGPAGPPAAISPVAAPAAAAPPTRPVADATPPGLAKELHRAPVVGGCGPACANAADAFTGFVAALAAADRQARVPLYLDTSRLRVDDDPVGERLAALWLQGAVSPRLQAVGELVDALAIGLTPQDEGRLLEVAHAARLEAWPARAAVALDVQPAQPPWRLRLERRGREWLVVSIDRR